MKILLVNPSHQEVYKKVPTVAGLSQPMGLLCIAAYMRENGFKEIEILDIQAEQLNKDEIKNRISKDINIIGCGSLTPNLKNAVEVFRIAKSINPKIITVLGGDHITALPKETIETFKEIDFGVIGEGEITFHELCSYIEKNRKDYENINGLTFRRDNEVNVNQLRGLIEDINILPIPAYDLVPMKKYSPPAHHTSFGGNVKLKPFTIFFSLRGCPYRCTYCASKVMWQRKVRYRSIENVKKEIDYLIKNYNIKCLEFNDENFIINKDRLNKLLDLLQDYHDKNGLSWNCLTRVDSVEEDILIRMKKAGCYFIRFGVESGSQTILNAMKKDITVQQVKDAFKLVNKVGIPSSASFILGYPGETKETLQETLDLAKEIDPIMAFFFIAIPIVGTELYNETKQKNLLLNSNWTDWVQMAETPMIKTENLSSEDLMKFRKKAYKEFYFRPKYIWKLAKGIRTKEQIKFYIKGALGALSLSKEK